MGTNQRYDSEDDLRQAIADGERMSDEEAWDEGIRSARMLGCVLMASIGLVVGTLLALVIGPLLQVAGTWLSS